MLPMALAQASMVICVLLPDDGPYTFFNPFGATLFYPMAFLLHIHGFLSNKLFYSSVYFSKIQVIPYKLHVIGSMKEGPNNVRITHCVFS